MGVVTKDIMVVYRDAAGRTVKVPASRASGVPLTGREAVWAPSRHPSKRSIATWWWSATTGRLVGCRSLQRLTVAMLLDFHPQVVDFQAWSARLEWRERGREKSLVPDFFLRTAADTLIVVACPPAAGPTTRFERQLTVLREVCQEAGWVLGAPPRPPGPVALANLRWVARYRHPRNGDAAVEGKLQAAFASARPLLEGVTGAGLPTLTALPRLYHRLWHRRLGIDWSVPLGPGSLVGPVGSEPQAMRQPYQAEDV
ncbi:TnsA-like heteromeric transposase endonuclease subunit [Streptomyces albus]|uniref:TnsA-like heteromeric transposase endonuclease subunit n=1 Tax=Streptomyces albus TaxID=1888 RepID=UPI0013B49A00|nr:TnsA-like heteromeric transposase endonuclease subunit [Streptomyces albus]QID39812.1 TnsA-like heteromeric transposase endonuclease subunit [Streptomyces albus]